MIGIELNEYEKIISALTMASVAAEMNCQEAEQIGNELLIKIRRADSDEIERAIHIMRHRVYAGIETPKAKAATA